MTDFDPKAFLATLTTRPGVYRMYDADGSLLYVGKAGNLKKRVSSYFRRSVNTAKTLAMMQQVANVEVTVTSTETEALILENNLIKEHRPRYNILLRDDKSYPYIRLSDHTYPRVYFYRGKPTRKGRLFGPFPSVQAVRESLNILQKLFLIRPCTDSFFANRSRPCLQYQIRRCSAPCVNYISPEDYARDLDNAVRFLEGRNREVIDDIVVRMERASEALEFETAARLRDQIAALRKAQEKQFVSSSARDTDILAVEEQSGLFCVAVLFVRGGRSLGSRTYFPQHTVDASGEAVLDAFISQYYSGREVPSELLVSHLPDDAELLEAILSDQQGRKVVIRDRVRGDRTRWLEMAASNAKQALAVRLASDHTLQQRFDALQQALELDQLPQRLECFDISHTGGRETVASCVVFGRDGAIRSDYRRFNIDDITPGDDYAAMRQVLTRRYTRLKKGEGVLPDILLVDGGKGQVTQAVEVLEELQVEGVQVVGVAKGPTRRPGLEQILLAGQERPTILAADSPALHLIQQIRDEAHRFAVAGHQHRRGKARRESTLESIEGLGPKRRQQLLKEFGGLQGVARAGIDDLRKVRGISRELARRVYEYFHGSD